MIKYHHMLLCGLLIAGTTLQSRRAEAQNPPRDYPSITTRKSNGSSDDNWQAKIQAIRSSCVTATQSCLDHFERYARSNRERAASAGFLGVGSGLTFWGTGEELHYTEVIRTIGRTQIEYQIGFGYVIFAKQRDAKIESAGVLFGLPANVASQAGVTQFSSAIIGIAPEAILVTNGKDADGKDPDCKSDNLDPASGLLCALDMQPTVTQAYYQTASGRMSAAFERWRRSINQPGATATICPQVINFREASRSVRDGAIPATPEILAAAREMNDMLSTSCKSPRPNARISYKSGLPELKALNGNVNIAIGDGGADVKQSLVAEGYYRTRSHLASITADDVGTSEKYAPDGNTSSTGSNKILVLFDNKSDHYAEFTMNGLKQSSKLPSILASIITMEQSDEAQRLRLQMACSGGSFGVPQGGNPVTDPVAFTTLVSEVRKAVDNPKFACPDVLQNELSSTRL